MKDHIDSYYLLQLKIETIKQKRIKINYFYQNLLSNSIA